MIRFAAIALVIAIAAVAPLSAQVVESPITLSVGLGGGASIPNGTLADGHNTGWHAGAKARLGGWLPVALTAMGRHNSLPAKTGDVFDDQFLLGGGVEFNLPSIVVHPYFGADVFYADFNNKSTASGHYNRTGLGLGAGVQFSLVGFGSFDTELKYQWLNMWGKLDGEPELSQIAATVTLMFDLL